MAGPGFAPGGFIGVSGHMRACRARALSFRRGSPAPRLRSSATPSQRASTATIARSMAVSISAPFERQRKAGQKRQQLAMGGLNNGPLPQNADNVARRPWRCLDRSVLPEIVSGHRLPSILEMPPALQQQFRGRFLLLCGRKLPPAITRRSSIRAPRRTTSSTLRRICRASAGLITSSAMEACPPWPPRRCARTGQPDPQADCRASGP